MNVCLRRSAVLVRRIFVFSILAFGQFFRVGVPFLWEGLSGINCVLSVFPAVLAVLICICVLFTLFTGCRKNPLMQVLFLSPPRANVFALVGMAIRLSVGGS